MFQLPLGCQGSVPAKKENVITAAPAEAGQMEIHHMKTIEVKRPLLVYKSIARALFQKNHIIPWQALHQLTRQGNRY